MTTVLLITWAIIVLLLVLLTAMRPSLGRLSRYELQRRAEHAGDAQAQAELRRYHHQASALGVARVLQLVAAIVSLYVAVAAMGLRWGIVLTIFILVIHPVLSRASVITRVGQRLYRRLETRVEQFAGRASWLYWLLRVETSQAPQTQLGSREELAHLIDQAGAHLSAGERELLLRSLAFEQRTVASAMLPAARLKTVDRRELLGPLVLDDLHKTGHSFFPVVDGDLRHIVGVLAIDGFLSLDDKRSVTAEKAMSSHVVYVRDTATLRVAITLFLQSHQHLLLVEDADGTVVGALTLYDCLGALFGRQR